MSKVAEVFWDEILRSEYAQRLRRARAEYKRMIRSANRSHWRVLTSLDPRDLFKIYRLITGKYSGRLQIAALRNPDGIFTSRLKETIEILLAFHSPVDRAELDSPEQAAIRQYVPTLGPDDPPFRKVEIEEVIDMIGLDGVLLEVIREEWLANTDRVLKVFNRVLEEESFPHCWKKGGAGNV